MLKKDDDNDELRFLHCILGLKASKSHSLRKSAHRSVANNGASTSSSSRGSGSSSHVCIQNLTEIIQFLGKPNKELYIEQCVNLKFDKILLDIIVCGSSDDKEIELSLKIILIISSNSPTEITLHLISLNLIDKVFDLLSRRSVKCIHDASCALLSNLRSYVDPRFAFDLLSTPVIVAKQSAFTILVNLVTNVGYVNGKLLDIDDSEWEGRMLPQLLRALIRPDTAQYCSAELVVSIILAYNEDYQSTDTAKVSSKLCTTLCKYISSLFICSLFAPGNALLANSNYAYDSTNGGAQLRTDPSSVSSYIIERMLSAIEDDQSQSIPRINVSAICHCMWTAGTHYAAFLRVLSYLKCKRVYVVY